MTTVSYLSLARQLAVAGCVLVLASCGGTPAKNADGSEAETSGTDDTKSTFRSIGADIGCGIASIVNKDCAKGAMAGARVADKVLSWVFKSLKIADGKTVNKEYEDKKIAVSKNDIEVKAFKTSVQTTDAPPPPPPPSDTKTTEPVQPITAKPPGASSEVKVTSNTDLVGYGDKVPVVTQKYALYDEKNKLVSTQTEKVAAVDGAGRYETEAKIKIPKTKGKGSKQYRVETTLIVNGKEHKKESYKVADLGDGELRFALLSPASQL